VQPYIEQGFRFIVCGVDTIMLGNAARGLLEQLRD
jgi:2-keto-3-deoxy-L-rhamnonate aldolase RhmA